MQGICQPHEGRVRIDLVESLYIVTREVRKVSGVAHSLVWLTRL